MRGNVTGIRCRRGPAAILPRKGEHMRIHAFVIALAALAAGLPAHAQQARNNGIRYHWVDAKGLPHYSDSLSEGAIKAGYDVLNSQGMVVQHVNKTLNAQERAAADKLAAQRAAEQRTIQQQERDDIQLLNAYPDVAAYQAALQQILDNLDQQIGTTRINLHSQEKALADLLARAADLENAKEPVPKPLHDRIASQRDVVADQRATLARQQDLRDATAQKQAQQLQHFRELKEAQKQERGY